LALSALALVAGLVIGLSGLGAAAISAAVLFVAIVAMTALLRNERGSVVVAALLITGIGGAILGGSARGRAEDDCRRGWAANESVRLRGIAIGYLPAGERGSVRVRPVAEEAAQECVWVGPVRAWADGPVRPGARYEIEGGWRPAVTPGRGPRPPDRSGWVVVSKIEMIEAARPGSHPFLAARGALAEGLWRTYPRRWAPLAQALVLGQRETMDPEVSKRIARAGLAHLLAISGLHVGMLALAFFAMARIGRLPIGPAQTVTVFLTIGYVLLIGAPASAVRAGLMVALWTLTRAAGRASSAFDVLGLTAMILLVLRPWSVLEPGFQLSFAGAAAVGYAHSEARHIRWPERMPRFARGLILGAVASAAAVLLTAPITANFFGRVAPAAIVGNLAAIPLLGLAMPALFLSAALSSWPPLAAWPAGAAVLLLRAIDALAGVLAGLRWASFEVTRPGLLPALTYLVLLVLGAHALHGAWQRRRFILAVGLAWSIVIAWPVIADPVDAERIAIYVLDVGQGDAIAVRTPGNRWLLVDAGPKVRNFDAGARRVVPFLREQGAKRLEAWVASHPDLDHVGGAPSIFDAVRVNRVISAGRVTGQFGQVALLRKLAVDSIPWLRADAGDRLLVDGVELSFLHPPGRIEPGAPLEPNEISLVLALRYGDFHMVFTGDIPASIEERLAREHGAELKSQVLKVAHHGSATSTSRSFLSSVDPELAVISVGRGNRYGHPSRHVVRRLALSGVELRRTDRDGTVVIEAERDGSWRVRSAAEGF
jgi:competence protein ComEC